MKRTNKRSVMKLEKGKIVKYIRAVEHFCGRVVNKAKKKNQGQSSDRRWHLLGNSRRCAFCRGSGDIPRHLPCTHWEGLQSPLIATEVKTQALGVKGNCGNSQGLLFVITLGTESCYHQTIQRMKEKGLDNERKIKAQFCK